MTLLKTHCETQELEQKFAAEAWADNDLVFCRDDGTPWPPDLVSRRFKVLARAAGVPAIKLHEGVRHTAASLGDDAGVDREINQHTLGHANPGMTGHYTHPEAARYREAAGDVARLVDGAES